MRCLVVASVLVACSSPAKPVHLETPPATTSSAVAPEVTAELDQLREGTTVRGFKVAALYLDDADHPIGAKLVHEETGFQLDYLRIESAPQGYIWVKTYPTSDQGEPHTQEHLLLGKGARGRRLGSSEAMALAESSAFTEQWHTAYHFHTVAGPDVYWSVFENHLDALLAPDYTDEEIRREVRNFGVAKADNGTLHLEEKGTVYNEMVRAYEDPEAILWRTAHQLTYGEHHPLSFESGGLPAAIRTMTPEDIRAFHDVNYQLANMGMIGAYPSSMPLASVLDHTAKILDGQARHVLKPHIDAQLPKPNPAAPGTLKIVAYPYAETANPGPMMFMWPATQVLDSTELALRGLFVDALASDESTPLYKKLIDSKTRVMELGASTVSGHVLGDGGALHVTSSSEPVMLELEGVRADKLDEPTLGEVRALILAELDHIAKLPANDPELVAFDRDVASRVIAQRRRLAKFLDSPPGFGIRGTEADWFFHLYDTGKMPAFAKSLTDRPALAAIDKLLAAGGNPWRDRIKQWGLLEVPYGVAAKPSLALRKQLDDERMQRTTDELRRLQAQYKTADAAATLARYQLDYDKATAELEAQSATELPPLVASPPMTLDDGLKYETGELGTVRTFTATFDSMQSAHLALSFDLAKTVAPADLWLLAGLPELLSTAGVIEIAGPISSAEMKERLRKEVLSLDVRYIGNTTDPKQPRRTQRPELAFSGSGLGAIETRAALAWIQRVLTAPDWRIENLPRLRDIVAQSLATARQRMTQGEESWIWDPRDAWFLQDALQAHTASFLTRIFDLHRLRWMFEDPRDPVVQKEAVTFLAKLGASKGNRVVLGAVAKQLATDPSHAPLAVSLSPKARAIARDAGSDLATLLADLPDDTLATDWAFLCDQMAKDLAFGAPAALAKLETLRSHIMRAERARIVLTASSANQQAIAPDVKALVDAIPTTPAPDNPDKPIGAAPKGGLRARLAARTKLPAHQPLFVGLYAPSTSSGVFLNTAKATAFADDKPGKILDYLTSNLYTGHGAHSLFMKTWAAGLAYSNGVHPFVETGELEYYAERCPLLPQTLRYVVDVLQHEKPDPNIVRYAVAKAFDSRIAKGYEQRAAAMAANLVDGIPPDLVREFRTKIIEQSQHADLAKDLYARIPAVYGKVLPGLAPPSSDVTYFVIGNTKQLAAYQDYLHAAVSRATRLFTIYPRDFWLP